MAITLGTNLPSFKARTQLDLTSGTMSGIMERLSSGLKINSAKDDAAGLVISENMDATIRGSKQALINIQNASNFLSVAEDGMVMISDHFQRINDLLVNMANDTNDIESRRAAVNEIIERLDEIDRVADSTNFNGKAMLNGKQGEIIVQMGPDSNEAISTLDISNALTDCHIKAFQAELPGYLNPEAKIDAANGNKIVIPVEQEDGTIKYIYEGTTDEYAGGEAAFKALKSAFDPSNKNCRTYMTSIQKAISDVSINRGLIGAYENRMESSYNSLNARIETLTAAKSNYTDTDIALEATNLTSQQILQQVQTSIIAQANSMQQVALSLLG